MTMKKKIVTMIVSLSVPSNMTAQEARREARTLINDQCNYSADYGDVRAHSVKPLPRA